MCYSDCYCPCIVHCPADADGAAVPCQLLPVSRSTAALQRGLLQAGGWSSSPWCTAALVTVTVNVTVTVALLCCKTSSCLAAIHCIMINYAIHQTAEAPVVVLYQRWWLHKACVCVCLGGGGVPAEAA